MKIFFKSIMIIILSIFMFISFQIFIYNYQQNKIAKALDVNIKEYDRDGFPINYFSQHFDETFSREQVLSEIHGYKKHCYIENWNSDIFYFYSSNWQDKDVIVLQIEYKNDKFYTLGTRDVKWENFGPCG